MISTSKVEIVPELKIRIVPFVNHLKMNSIKHLVKHIYGEFCSCKINRKFVVKYLICIFYDKNMTSSLETGFSTQSQIFFISFVERVICLNWELFLYEGDLL